MPARVILDDLIITNATSYKVSQGAFRLLDGEPATIPHPLTGEMIPWTFTRSYGCNTAVASENLLTFRSGAAGFYDLTTHCGTGNFGGFKSGCSSNLIVANGVLNAPDYTRTCTCGYQNQTSLALVPMPEMEMWAHNTFRLEAAAQTRVRRVGVNLGAWAIGGPRTARCGWTFPEWGVIRPKYRWKSRASPPGSGITVRVSPARDCRGWPRPAPRACGK